MPSHSHILVLYYSRTGNTQKMALEIANGIESTGCEAMMRTVPAVSNNTEASEPSIPIEGAPYCTLDELQSCEGLVMGSPTRFGNMAAPLKHFLDQTSNIWISGNLVGKPAGLFTSTSTLHGGQESTLLSMAIPLLHHGMVITGIPFTEPELHSKVSSASPYGATSISSEQSNELTTEERKLCFALGKRVANLAKKINSI